MALITNLYVDQDTTFSEKFNIEEEDGSFFNLYGWNVIGRFSKSLENTAIFNLTTLVTDSDNGEIEVSLSSSDSSLQTIQLTGTVTTIDDGEDLTLDIVTGTGTSFLTDFRVGEKIKIGTETRIIESIDSDTSLTVTSIFSSNTSQLLSKVYDLHPGRYFYNILLDDGEGTKVKIFEGILIISPSLG